MAKKATKRKPTKKRAPKRPEKPARPVGRPPNSTPTVAELTAKAAKSVGSMTQRELHLLAQTKKDLAKIQSGKEWTLAELEERAASGKITQSQLTELVALRHALAKATAQNAPRPVLTVREMLERAEVTAVRVMYDVAENTSGSDVARVQAAKALKQWAEAEGVGRDNQSEEVVNFLDPSINEDLDLSCAS